MASVVNVRVKHLRESGFDNLREWMKDPDNVYVGRKGIVFIDGQRFPKEDALWANPFTLKEFGDETLEIYEAYLRWMLENEEGLLEKLYELKGKTLGCWCHPNNCHGDVLIKVLKEKREV